MASEIQLLYPVSSLQMILRILLAAFVGGVIGWERQAEHKPAGLRTHMLVSLGSALFVLTGIQTGMTRDHTDAISRIMQGIITGIGFLGAGEIVDKLQTSTNEFKIRGLTSAAAIWVSSALGVAAGCGLWQMALFSTLLTFIILRVIKRIERKLAGQQESGDR